MLSVQKVRNSWSPRNFMLACCRANTDFVFSAHAPASGCCVVMQRHSCSAAGAPPGNLSSLLDKGHLKPIYEPVDVLGIGIGLEHGPLQRRAAAFVGE